jgi:hypothetical protein
MRYPTCYIVVRDGDKTVNSAAFNQLVTSKGLHRFNGFGCSTDTPLSALPNANLHRQDLWFPQERNRKKPAESETQDWPASECITTSFIVCNHQ